MIVFGQKLTSKHAENYWWIIWDLEATNFFFFWINSLIMQVGDNLFLLMNSLVHSIKKKLSPYNVIY